MTNPAQSPRDALAARIRKLLASRPDVREVNMFGGLSFMVDERMAVAAGREGDLLVRTDPVEYYSLIARGATPAEMGGRAMGRGWLTVPAAQLHDEAELEGWIEVGIVGGRLR